MKKLLILLFALFVFSLSGVDYGNAENWVICDSAPAGAAQPADLFYVYPTLTSDRDCALMDWSDSAVAAKTVGFTAAQTGIFGGRFRVFAPYVRQLEFGRCILSLRAGESWEASEMKTGIEDTADAFRYYLDHYNCGRPVVLLGHSQGAVDLYCLLKNCPEITAAGGLVAAYLPGLPKITAERFSSDFAGRDIHPAVGADDTGAVIVWNTRRSDAVDDLFTCPGGLCVNPLNWRTDSVPASASENLGAFFYDLKTGITESGGPYCGVAVDPDKGALVVDLPAEGFNDAGGMLGAGVFHVNDIWFFAGNLRENAIARVRARTEENHRRKTE